MEAAKSIRKTLRPCKEESKNWDTTENLYIEGDNLDVLKLLQESYLGKVKMIYIDPPYNTGNDFIYKDDFSQTVEEYEEATNTFDEENNRLVKNNDTNGRFHSDWCSMIYPRLLLARNLLSDDGVIFISIDDNEYDNLKKICDEVLGESNYRNTIITRRRIKSLNSQFAENGLQTLNIGFEYILVYAKSKNFFMKALRQRKVEVKTKGEWQGFWSNADRPTMRYEILGFTPTSGQWRSSKDKAYEAINNYKIYLEKYAQSMTIEEYAKKTGIINFIKRDEKGKGKNGGVYHWVAPSNSTLRTTNWTDIEVSQIIKEINLPFSNPKNKILIEELIKLTEFTATDTILDFFSGSATTAHAVMQLNAEDGGKRKFIMVQLPEKTDEKSEAFKAGYKNICEIGKERIRRAGEKVKQEAGLNGADLDIGFRVFKLDSTNVNDVYYSAGEYDQQMLQGMESNIKADRTDMDLLFGCLLDWGLPLSLPYTSEMIDGFAVHTYNDGDLIACFAENLSEKVIEEIAQRQPLRAVFRDSSFVDSPAKINVWEKFKLLAPDTQVKVI